MEETCLNVIKAIYDNSQLISYSVEKLKTSFKIRYKTKIPILATCIQHTTGSSSQSNCQMKIQMNGIQVKKEKLNLSLFADDMILCTENPKDSTRNC